MGERARNWCWTIFNYNDETEASIAKWGRVRYTTYGKEHTAAGRPHLQGYTEFLKPLRPSALKKLHPTAHWERREGTRDEARNYCHKEDPSPVEIGDWELSKGERTDLQTVKEKIDEGATEADIADEFFGTWCRNYKALERYRALKRKRRTKPRVVVMWGPTGTGKTYRAAEMGGEDAYWLDSRWWDGYDGHETVIIDEFNGWIPANRLLRVLDRYPIRVENKGGSRALEATTIIITSHFHPAEWYSDQDRWPELERRIDELIHLEHGTEVPGNTEPAPVPTVESDTDL